MTALDFRSGGRRHLEVLWSLVTHRVDKAQLLQSHPIESCVVFLKLSYRATIYRLGLRLTFAVHTAAFITKNLALASRG
jgi:hypothetical protein